MPDSRHAEADVHSACFHARRAIELPVAWACKHDPALQPPYQENLSALIHEPPFKQTAEQLQRLESGLRERDEKLAELQRMLAA